MWAAVRAHSREDRDYPKWSPSPLVEPAPRGVTHVSLCLSRGYDESTESPSGFLIFPTAAITSRFCRQTRALLTRPLAWTHTRSRPFAVNSKTDQGSRAGPGYRLESVSTHIVFQKGTLPSISFHQFTRSPLPTPSLMVLLIRLASPVNIQILHEYLTGPSCMLFTSAS